MRIDSLKLVNFRNFQKKEFDFKESINLISAPNGSGKTNVLESIRIMCYGKPIFMTKEVDVINFENIKSNLPFTKIIMNWNDEAGDEEYISSYTLSPTIKPVKSLEINNIKKTPRNFAGRFSIVWFSPETINVITSTPKSRRELLDMYFCQLNPEYILALMNYQKALEARNRVLKAQDRSNIGYYLKKYNVHLAQYAVELIKQKNVLARLLEKEVRKSSKKQERYSISWKYEPNVELSAIFEEDLMATIMERLKESELKDISSKRTNVGPHRDNWTLELVDNHSETKSVYDLRFYGSRGQKRMGLLIFTLAMVNMLEDVKGSKPVLLLDDVVSELDDENVGLILNMLNSNDQQSIITSTHDKIEGLDKVNLIKLYD